MMYPLDWVVSKEQYVNIVFFFIYCASLQDKEKYSVSVHSKEGAFFRGRIVAKTFA